MPPGNDAGAVIVNPAEEFIAVRAAAAWETLPKRLYSGSTQRSTPTISCRRSSSATAAGEVRRHRHLFCDVRRQATVGPECIDNGSDYFADLRRRQDLRRRADGFVVALKRRSGVEALVKNDCGGSIVGTPAVADDGFTLCTVRKLALLRAVSLRRALSELLMRRGIATPLIAGGVEVHLVALMLQPLGTDECRMRHALRQAAQGMIDLFARCV